MAISGSDLLEVPTIFLTPMIQAYVRGQKKFYGQKYGTVPYLHFRILEFPLMLPSGKVLHMENHRFFHG